MKILIVEDDEEQARDLQEELEKNFKGVEITCFELERDFLDHFQEIATGGYDLAILDMMLEWSILAPDTPEPPGPFDEAGLRCRNVLKTDPRTAKIPVIMLSVLRKSMPEDVAYIVKTHDLSGLIAKAKELLTPPAQ